MILNCPHDSLPRIINVVLNSIHLEGQGRQPPASQPPAVTDQPPAAAASRLHTIGRQPPSHLKVELSCFEFVYK